MSVLTEKKEVKKEAKSPAKALTGYARPLFVVERSRYNDDRAGGGNEEKLEVKEHDRKISDRILDALCFDIFCSADDLDQDKYKDVPYCAEESEENLTKTLPRDQVGNKPLDSKHRKRTYILDTTPEPKIEKPRRGRGSRKPSSRKRGNSRASGNRRRPRGRRR